MKKVVIISGHPDFKNSVANKAILEEIAAKCPQVEIRKLDELYPDYQFDVKTEQAALEAADVIIFQYPMHWFGVPGIMKLYIDKVMLHGWAYGSQGNALKGKAFIASVTTGAPDAAYKAEGVMQHTVDEFSYPIEKFAATCKMDCKKIFHICGMMYVPGLTTDAQKQTLIDNAKKYADDVVDYINIL